MSFTTDPHDVETDDQREERIQQWRLSRALRDAPEIFAHVRALAISGRTERGDEVPHLDSPLRITAEDDIDDRYARLNEWVDYFAAQLTIAPPVVRIAARRHDNQDIQGFRVGVTPEGASVLVSLLTMWLNIHHEQIINHDQYLAYREDVIEFLGELSGRYPVDRGREKPVLPRPCPACGLPAVRAEWWSENTHDVKVACELCEEEIPRKHYAKILDWVVG
ncbi:hypothetical protein LLS1_18710 [Leifsonia sp. LS1]|uniref:hypothetical protein n=1 Tax=Leifsonia sp. LS1 TaxID=2828483 RepID=UPI001CFC6959|nr:hypothetical protein [Leifsonia sp. LS1]GIT80202.1 hypothetical protein LLS1_18710 [Leifsonia sp. LS1]